MPHQSSQSCAQVDRPGGLSHWLSGLLHLANLLQLLRQGQLGWAHVQGGRRRYRVRRGTGVSVGRLMMGGLRDSMDRYSELRARAAEFVAEWARWGAVVVVGPVREAADEVALAACGDALVGVHRLAFRELVGGLSAAELKDRKSVAHGKRNNLWG